MFKSVIYLSCKYVYGRRVLALSSFEEWWRARQLLTNAKPKY